MRRLFEVSLVTLLLSASASVSVSLTLASPAHVARDADVMARIDTYARYAAAAYCNNLANNGTNNTVCTNPDPKQCFDLAGATTVYQYDGKVAVNVAVNPGHKVIVASFRGTQNILDFITDVDIPMIAPQKRLAREALAGVPPGTTPPVPCQVHRGFWHGFLAVKDDLLKVIARQVQAHPDYRVVVSGHSLGGALASVAAAYLRKASVKADLYTYGSPRIGDVHFAEFVSGQNGGMLRVTNKEDPITVVPPVTFLGYANTSPEYWFPDKPKNPEYYKVCSGYQNTTECSGQFYFKPWLINTQHRIRFYEGGFEACPGDSLEDDLLDTSRLSREDMERLSKALHM
ncbi:Triacylglycerol lipase [Metarhizium rileyi]|uniref:Triacylglycerol lipase n=1 Tax=Metarhizium rileyi (strain RCEF 4871) TaxID=1649241 RepID=A0A166VUZ4_METRR|nr:Triacylglycerol lipase [Metarhizium rileyi RCEF 4871]